MTKHKTTAIAQSSKPGAIIIEGHIQGLSNTRALGEIGVPVFVVDTDDCVARRSKYCQEFYKCPPFNSDELADFLISIATKKNFTDWLLLPSNDHAVLTLSRNKQRLGKHYKVITPGLDIIENIYDKFKLLQIAKKVEVPIPQTSYIHNAYFRDIPLSFPVLTRGRFGLDFYKATGCKAFLANNNVELSSQLSLIKNHFPLENALIQEVIPDDGKNKTISFAAFCVNGKINAFWMGEKLREHPIRFGTATFARSVYIQECYLHSVPLIKALDYSGICEIEYLKDPRDGQYKLIEINARTWLWVGLAKACGVDFAKMAYAYVNGMAIDYPEKYKVHLCWINPLTDPIYAAKAVFHGRLSPLEYVRSISNGRKVNALFGKHDWKPGFAYLGKLVSYLRKR